MSLAARDTEHIYALSLLTLNPGRASEALEHVSSLNDAECEVFLKLADSHHVVLRALEPLQIAAQQSGFSALSGWCLNEIEREKARIANAVSHLQKITDA